MLVDPGCLKMEDGSNDGLGVPVSPELGLCVLGLRVVIQYSASTGSTSGITILSAHYQCLMYSLSFPLHVHECLLDMLHDDVIKLLAYMADNCLEELQAIV